MTSINVQQIGDSEIVWDSVGRLYQLENIVEARTLGCCIHPGCKAFIYMARQGDLRFSYLITKHQCDKGGAKQANETEKEKTDMQTQVDWADLDENVDDEEEHTKKCLFRVKIEGSLQADHETCFNVVSTFTAPKLLSDAIGQMICIPTAPECFVEVSRWDADFNTYSKMCDDEILTAYCEEGCRYKVVCHTEAPETTIMAGWMVKISECSEIELGETSSLKTTSTASICSDADSESSLYEPQSPSRISSYSSESSLICERFTYSMPPVEALTQTQAVTPYKREKRLEAVFRKAPTPELYKLIDLSFTLDMSISEIREWFGRRRAQELAEKRQSTSSC
ncbi:hypothetical protein QR680_007375 [Steinernema hermaphroditum]|uniref:Homeobox domain-containing protein n=1 Tax=Steinernema hermaphroditum TaxID=289476 RepID=A0AA39IEE8_9BILA|nr:hypothetical protein QR680_007375 [Steinernema hermaphroditum]